MTDFLCELQGFSCAGWHSTRSALFALGIIAVAYATDAVRALRRRRLRSS